AYQKNVAIVGGSRREPQRIRVQLVAALSLIEVVVRNAWDKADFPNATTTPLTKRVKSLLLKNIPKYFSNPTFFDISSPAAADLEYEINIPEANYSQTEVARFAFYVPESIDTNRSILEISGKGFSKAKIYLNTHKKQFLEDILLYPRLINKRGERNVNKYLEKLKKGAEGALLHNEWTHAYLRNFRYQVIIDLNYPDQPLDVNIIVNPWNKVRTKIEFTKEGSDIPTDVIFY
ncbi:MAG: hypothetical protein ACRC9P_10270, partial [Bacteroides sp.]